MFSLLSDTLEIAGYVALVGVGIMLGTTGIGGSILSVPILVYLFSLDVVTASAYSLFIVGITSLVGTAVRQKEGQVDLKAGLTFAIPSIAGAFSARKWVVGAIPDHIVQWGSVTLTRRELLLGILAATIIYVSIRMIVNKRTPAVPARPPAPYALAPIGLATGLAAGLLGVGGGFVILPVLVIFARISMEQAVGTTLMILSLNSLLGFVGDTFNYPIDWSFLLSITALSVAGIFVGIFSGASHLPSPRLIGWATLAVGVWIAFSELLR